jgi:hypothetical protein
MKAFDVVVFEDENGTRHIYSDAAIGAISGPGEGDRIIAAFSSADSMLRVTEADKARREMIGENLVLRGQLRLAIHHIAALSGALEDLARLGATIAICGTEYDDAAARKVLDPMWPAKINDEGRSNAAHWRAAHAEEARKFQAETLRAASLAVVLRQFSDHHRIEYGHEPGPWSRTCTLCSYVRSAEALLGATQRMPGMAAVEALVTPNV